MRCQRPSGRLSGAAHMATMLARPPAFAHGLAILLATRRRTMQNGSSDCPASLAGYLFVDSKAATSCRTRLARLAEGRVRKLSDGVSGYSGAGDTATAQSAPAVLQSRRRPAVTPDLKGWWRRKCLGQQVRPDADEDRLHQLAGIDLTSRNESNHVSAIPPPQRRLAMNYLGIVALALCAVVPTGCASLRPSALVTPSEVTLENALEEVGRGLKKMYDAEQGLKVGLIPSEIEVKFNLAASAKDSGKLTIDLSKSVPEPIKKETKVGGSIEQSSEGERSNTMTVKFVNILMIPKDTLAQTKSSADLSALLKAWKDVGGNTWYSAPPSPEMQKKLNQSIPKQ